MGDSRPYDLTVGTYPQKSAVSTLKATAAKASAKTIALSGGAVGYVATPATSVYFARPGENFLVEIFDPSAARARQLVVAGDVTPAG